MRTRRHTVEVAVIFCSILAVAGSLLAVHGWAQIAESEGTTEVDISAQQEAPDATMQQDAPDVSPMQESPDLSATESQDTGGGVQEPRRSIQERQALRKERAERIRLSREKAAQNQAVPPALARATAPTGIADLGARQEASVGAPIAATVSRRVVPLSGIEVSFKLDPRQTGSLYEYMGEGWVTPPVSIHADTQAGMTPTVDAKADVLDAKGQPMDVSPEWIPADPEMVTVSPGQGNAVMITVRHAGQSSLRVASQKLYTHLSVMAWYQDDVLQVEISQKP